MGDMADFINESYDEQDWFVPTPPPRAGGMCRYCGRRGCYWRKGAHDEYILVNRTGKDHVCNKKVMQRKYL